MENPTVQDLTLSKEFLVNSTMFLKDTSNMILKSVLTPFLISFMKISTEKKGNHTWKLVKTKENQTPKQAWMPGTNTFTEMNQ